jgi:hypothetical protein
MPLKLRDIKQRIAQASKAIDKDCTLKGIEAAARFKAPYHWLIARRRGWPMSYIRGGYNKKLSKPKDEPLKDYILIL